MRGDTPDLADAGYHDTVASLVVRSGRWEICSQPGFKGYCAFFPPGEYPALSARFNDRIASARLAPRP